MIYIITGERGIGKTSYLEKLQKRYRNKGIEIAGILTPAVLNSEGEKIGFQAHNLQNDEKWECARIDKKLDGPAFGPFYFSENGFNRANRVIDEALKSKNAVFFLDEIGPLELSRKKGFYPCFEKIRTIDEIRNCYFVIRPELIDVFIESIIPEKKYTIIRITSDNRDSLIPQ